MNFKHIHIGNLIKKRVEENLIDIDRICNFFKTNEKNIQEMYEKQSIDSETLLRWSKLLEYDFFMNLLYFCIYLIQDISNLRKKI